MFHFPVVANGSNFLVQILRKFYHNPGEGLFTEISGKRSESAVRVLRSVHLPSTKTHCIRAFLRSAHVSRCEKWTVISERSVRKVLLL